MKQTSTAVSPSFPHTQFSQLLFFCLNKKQRAEPQIGTRCGLHNHPPLPAILSSSHPPCGLAKRKQTVGRKGRRPCSSGDSPPPPPCVDSESSQVTASRAFAARRSAKNESVHAPTGSAAGVSRQGMQCSEVAYASAGPSHRHRSQVSLPGPHGEAWPPDHCASARNMQWVCSASSKGSASAL